ncbi:histone-lysine N-methyltransferase, H3 lysine-79 specific [Camponotus floridanus]|uniref:histone-lysine N-methyltransferase, H3 lysine-79 specific n=1 Tax=Camponotus floridanus TaxID=104421 RepID=UPI00059C88B3|nr:histone-lysine N-methyltransferase, H3 lysine-79 specific [Camponotus floridanus]
MINDSDTDSWKTESDESEKKIALIHHCANYDEIREDVAKKSNSGPEIRYINPAIYTESVGEKEHNVTQIHRTENDHYYNRYIINANHHDNSESSTINVSSIKDATSVDHAIEHPVQDGTGRSTYRCYSTSLSDTTLFSEPFTVRSIVDQSSARTAKVERRCKIDSVSNAENEPIKRDKYRENRPDNHQVVRISMTSLSTGPSSDYQASNADLGKRIGHSEWIRRKDEETQRRKEEEERTAKKRQEEEERMAQEKKAKARLEKENFLKWMEKKRQQEVERKAILENELELQRRLKEIEDKAAVAKALYLRQWIQRKEEEQKTRHKEQEMRRRKMAEERERRLELSSKAYEKWRQNSRNKPKPATQGLLPHQKAKPAYVNPIPWQSIVDIDADEAQENAFNDKKGNINQLKMSGRKTIAVHH